ncbi:MAG: STAS domain-containing protein [Spirochaetes bacterium]|nr:STAS domain-containing protein [Spirochaetota bacterium]
MIRITQIVDRFSALHPETPASVAEERGRVVLGLSGSFDIKLAGEVEGLLASVIDQLEAGRSLVVDLAAVYYVSSTGIGALVTSLVRAQRRNVPFLVRNMTKKVRSVFDILGLLHFFSKDESDD